MTQKLRITSPTGKVTYLTVYGAKDCAKRVAAAEKSGCTVRVLSVPSVR